MDKHKIFTVLSIVGSVCTIAGGILSVVTQKSDMEDAVAKYIEKNGIK